MKKILSVILCLAMLMSFAVPAFAAVESNLPVIYIVGKGNNQDYDICDAQGNILYDPNDLDAGAHIMDVAPPVLKELAKALVTGDYSVYIDSLVAATAVIYEDHVLDKNGEASNGTGIPWDYKNAPIEKKDGYYYFYYDWRLSPVYIADQLDVYIERVLAETGASQVNVHCRCLGANFTAAYLSKSFYGEYSHPFRVRNLLINTGGLAGYITLGSLLSGSIEFTPDTIDRFVTAFLDGGALFDDPMIASLAATAVSLMNSAEILDLGVDLVAKIYNDIAPELLPKLALCCYGGYPSYWSMVSDKYYDKAKATIFSTPELQAEYKGFIEKIDEYHALLGDTNEKTGRPLYEDLLLDLDKAGVGIAVVAKYGMANVPMFEGSEQTGDMRGTVEELSFGATGTDIGKTFSDDYLKEAQAKGIAKYISPDKTVDASTALFPDRTWFIKNIAHEIFPVEVDDICTLFFASDGKMTVCDSETFPQYLDYVDGKVIADEGESKLMIWTNNVLELLSRFFKSLVGVIKSLLTK